MNNIKKIAEWKETSIQTMADEYDFGLMYFGLNELDNAIEWFCRLGFRHGSIATREEIACMIEQKFCGIGLEIDIAKAIREWGEG